jgi:antitoxin component YwqK of YwqJK toxin-antitoxin module
MIRFFASIFLTLVLSTSAALSLSMGNLVYRDGLWYEKFTEAPFTGELDDGPSLGRMKGGEQDGPWVTHYDNGQLWFKRDYKNGKQEGPWFWYYENGQLLEAGEHKNGKREGPFVWYHVNGQLGQKGEYKNGEREGLWVEYYDYGWLWYKGEYKNGKREGPWLWHDEDGNKVQPLSGTYRNGEKISD